MFDFHHLNPINLSEGGDSLVSPSGIALARSGSLSKAIFRPRANLMFPERLGPAPFVFTPRRSLPYVQDQWAGPIHLGPANAGK